MCVCVWKDEFINLRIDHPRIRWLEKKNFFVWKKFHRRHPHTHTHTTISICLMLACHCQIFSSLMNIQPEVNGKIHSSFCRPAVINIVWKFFFTSSSLNKKLKIINCIISMVMTFTYTHKNMIRFFWKI